ncbi:MAG: alpha-amylase family glycosyl hydrolase, partial [Verrucomicrobiota bacterium]
MKAAITQDDIIYFIVTDRFFGVNKTSSGTSDTQIHGGTLDGILAKLDYLKTLGITAIWITPVYKNINTFFSSEPYHYYWTEDFDSIDPRLLNGTKLSTSTDKGTLHAFVDQCEAAGFKVVLDMVVNHCGYGAEHHFASDWFNHGTEGDVKKPLAGLPDFNHDNPEVLDYFISNVKSWIQEGKVTNIRMDTVKHVESKFWHYFRAQIKGEFPDTFLLGEVLCEGKDDVSKLLEYQNYHDFDSIFDFPLCTALR